jgi:HSP20 family protein
LARPERNMLEPLRREVDQLFDEFARGLNTLAVPGNGSFMPNTEITETDKEFVITAELPGLERKDVEISLEDNVLTIRAENVLTIRAEKDTPERLCFYPKKSHQR